MLLLAFDTATPAVTVAVHDGSQIVGEASGSGAMAHGELLAPAIRDALTAAGAHMSDLTDVAVGVGPGPFTGLRVGVVTALTLGRTLGIATHGVCSLDIVAAAIPRSAHASLGTILPADDFLVATDARRKEVYWARYSAGARVEGPDVLAPTDLASRFPDLPVHGPGAGQYPEVLRALSSETPRAADLAELIVSGRADELTLEPLYLRRPDAVPSVAPKQA